MDTYIRLKIARFLDNRLLLPLQENPQLHNSLPKMSPLSCIVQNVHISVQKGRTRRIIYDTAAPPFIQLAVCIMHVSICIRAFLFSIAHNCI